jgi:hypothetical protein
MAIGVDQNNHNIILSTIFSFIKIFFILIYKRKINNW